MRLQTMSRLSCAPALLLAGLSRLATRAALAVGLPSAATGAQAQEQVLNLYSARHYQTDEALYANFTKATGIKINRVDADDAGILTRLQSEGAASPADVILLVDAARLWRAEDSGLFQPVKSKRARSAHSGQPARRPARQRCGMVRPVDPRAGHRLQQARRSTRPMSRPTRASPTRRTRARSAPARARIRTTCRCSAR